MKNKGFTLVEIMITVTIIGLLAVITVFQVLDIKQKAEDASIQAELHNIYSAVVNYYLITGQAPQTWNDLNGYIDISNIKDKYELNPNGF